MPKEPVLFNKPPNTIAGPDDDVVLPPDWVERMLAKFATELLTL